MAGPESYRVLTSFAVPGGPGFMRQLGVGAWVAADDPVVATHRAYLQAGSEYIEQMTARPGELRNAPVQEAARRGRRNRGEDSVPHSLPPEHEDSPASTFAPFQPGAGVVADDKADVPEQNPGGGISATEATEVYAGKEMPPVGDAVALDEADAPMDTDKSEGKANKSSKG